MQDKTIISLNVHLTVLAMFVLSAIHLAKYVCKFGNKSKKMHLVHLDLRAGLPLQRT